ncbi:MAG: carbohydrate ABC transporter permease [Oscillospiraceae bacterium]|nr:carbohydrate ABC transporter permease [Oscillospiraceae bacterium]
MSSATLIAMKKKARVKSLIGRFFLHLLIIAFGFLMLYPVLWMFLSSFQSDAEIFSNPNLIPTEITFENYRIGWRGFAGVNFGRFFINSIFISSMAVLANVVACSLAAFAFGRLKFSGKRIMFTLMMLTLMLPAHVTTIPRFVMYNSFGWINTYYPFIVPRLLATEAFFVFLLVQFVRSLPKELDEAATIDGCGPFGVYTRIILPLSKPALVTVALFTFLWSWDDFFNQLLFIASTSLFTVPLGLRSFVDATGAANWGAVLAMSTLSILPVFILFFALQKYFVQGIATSGIKG